MNGEKEQKYFAVFAKEPGSMTLPRGEVFIAENEDDAIEKMKNTLGRETLAQSPKIEFETKQISEREYNQELAMRKINIEKNKEEGRRNSEFQKWHEGKNR
ncbi:hypothetical protein BMS3Abin15_00865 [bacterium BMS3Abin15]|nr:hypothetical protein BMS3Abin15_00865 [bacterium BMS3Abin15]HDH07517.1 hypothetical protein [Candidatus Moranbacteria bacterium]HDZ85982.1 hypothetical protein [Candidatus Moranbacteria bacterium]